MIPSKHRPSPRVPSLCLLMLAGTLLFTGCAVQKQRLPRPSPAVREQPVTTTPPGIPPGTPREESAVEEEPAPPPHGVAGSLHKSADKSLAAGRFSQAEVLVERALRLEPRNPELWHMMARVKLGQNNPAQAVQFCLKANTLATGNRALTRRNWRLLAKAYQAMGQGQQAAQARARGAR